jgi:2-isopropylmalate synthase
VDLAQLLVVLKTDFKAPNPWKLDVLPELYELVSRFSGIAVPANQPITGRNAFTHCAGVHTQAAAIDPLHYESLSPELVGRVRRISLDHMSGLSSVKHALAELGEADPDEATLHRILERVKSVGTKGKTVDLTELRYIVNWCKEHKD